MRMARLILAGTGSGCGKTTLTMGLLSLLRRRGLTVQPFKVGPDFIDPMFHQYVTGRPSANLDSWLLDEATLRRLFAARAADADLAVIEGVMGLFDGQRGVSLQGSTAQMAQILQTPIVLVVNAAGMSLSVAALIRGFQQFIPGLPIQGVILNQLKSKSHFLLLKRIIETENGVNVLGYLPYLPEITLPSRHLGLIPQAEIDGLTEKLGHLTGILADTIDLEALVALASGAGPLDAPRSDRRALGRVRLGVAQDAAFNFYYHDNFALLRQLGAELIFFSPLSDGQLPEGLDGLYFGGGYPEVFAATLSANRSMRENVRRAAERGMPVYAECGGLLYLCRNLTDQQGATHEMCAVFPVAGRITGSLQHFGYVEVETIRDTLLGPAGQRIRAHEFHYSEITGLTGQLAGDQAYRVTKERADGAASCWSGGLTYQNVLAAYPHLHFEANPSLAENWLRRCAAYGKGSC